MTNTTSSFEKLIKATESRKDNKRYSKEYLLKLYGITSTSNDGTFENGRESFTQVFSSYENCIDYAYESYCFDWEELEKNKVIDTDSCYVFLSKEKFKEELNAQGLVVIQCYDCHFQYEFFEQELVINKEMLKENIKDKNERGDMIRD